LVMDSHSKPSAAAALVAQIKKEVTTKPVRFVVNSHFHWDHIQGNSAYKAARNRLKESMDGVPAQIDTLQKRMANSTNAAEKAFCQEQIRQFQAYLAEMKNFSLELPTIAFAKSHVIKD